MKIILMNGWPALVFAAFFPGYVPADILEGVESPRLEPFVLCTGIEGADGIALSAGGVLYVAAESQGKVYRIDPPGIPVVVAEGLRHPEGLAVAGECSLLVTEDVDGGRILLVTPEESLRVLAGGLAFPEGVAAGGGRVLFTESSAETGFPPPFRTGVGRVGDEEPLFSSLYLWSLSDMVVDDKGTIYACNESSGFPLVRESVIRIDADTGEWSVFARDLKSCEGICSTPGSFFPLLVVEEDTGNGSGRLVSVDSSGNITVLARGFGNLEDVAVDEYGRIFVSEDSSGRILMLIPRTSGGRTGTSPELE